MNKIIGTIEGSSFTQNDDGSISFLCQAQVDGDGSGGNAFHDPDFQAATSLRVAGKSLDAETVKYGVLPPGIINSVLARFLGCRMSCFNILTLKRAEAVVGDIGPRAKLGEFSVALCQALGIPDSPVSGGDSRHIIKVTVYPGVPAVVDGVTYPLQAA